MARRRYFRYYPRTRVAKKKWASNYKTFALDGSTKYITLVENKSQANAPTPTIIKTGNFKVQGDGGIQNTTTSQLAIFVRVYILFVPEGWDPAGINTIPSTHPEWIMGWTAIDMPMSTGAATVGGNKFSITSRLKRNLNSGDKVVICYESIGVTSGAIVTLIGATQFWTCAN